LERLKAPSHYKFDDGRYSCPMAENYIGFDSINFCSCGAKKYNERIDSILRLLKK
jgi:hypothetical protein